MIDRQHLLLTFLITHVMQYTPPLHTRANEGKVTIKDLIKGEKKGNVLNRSGESSDLNQPEHAFHLPKRILWEKTTLQQTATERSCGTCLEKHITKEFEKCDDVSGFAGLMQLKQANSGRFI